MGIEAGLVAALVVVAIVPLVAVACQARSFVAIGFVAMFVAATAGMAWAMVKLRPAVVEPSA